MFAVLSLLLLLMLPLQLNAVYDCDAYLLRRSRIDITRTVAMGRSRSTPGLLESRGKKTLEDTSVRDDFLTRPKPAKASSTCEYARTGSSPYY